MGKVPENFIILVFKKRVDEAKVALKFLAKDEPTTICAFSMGGHIALELLRSHRIDNLILFSPAIYTPKAFEVPFDDRFTKIIRQKDSWKKAKVVELLRSFIGKILVFYGENDEVIPRDAITLIYNNAKRATQKELIVFPGVTYNLIEAALVNTSLMNTISSKIIEFVGQEGFSYG